MTDAVQPLIVTSASARKPADEPQGRPPPLLHARPWQPPRSTPRATSSAPIEAVDARLTERFGAYCWFVDVDFADGTARPSRPDRRRPHGLARGLPDLRRERQRPREDLQPLVLQDAARSTSSARPTPAGTARSAPTATSTAASSKGFADVDPRRRADARRRPRGRHRLGARHGGHRAIGRDRPAGRARRRRRGGLMQLGIFAKTFDTRGALRHAGGRARRPATPRRSSTWPASACPPCRTRIEPAVPDGDRRRVAADRRRASPPSPAPTT